MPDPDRPRLVRTAGRDAWVIRHQRRRQSTGCADRASAELVLAAYVRDLERAQLPAIGIAGMLDRYLATRVEAKRPGAERLRWAHKPLAAHFGARPPEAIGEDECAAYRREREAAGAAASTIRTEIQALRAALTWAEGRKLIGRVGKLPLPPRSPPRERWLTRSEADRLVAACKAPHIRLFVLVALHTTARASAILELRWDRVELEQRRIDFRLPGRGTTKKGRAQVPINDTLQAALVSAYGFRTTSYVIEWAGDRVASVKTGFREATRRAGLPGVTPHTLRHTGATWMAQMAVPWWQIAGMMGHSSPRMVEDTYGHHHPDFLAEAAAALG